MFYTWGVVGCPPCLCTLCMFICPPICLYAPIHLFTPRGVHTPHGPPCSQCSCMVLEHCMLWGVVFLLNVYWGKPPLLGVPPPYYPHTPLLVTCALLFSGISVLCGGLSPSIEGFGGCFPITWGGLGGTSAPCCSHVHCYTFFCSALCLTSRPCL